MEAMQRKIAIINGPNLNLLGRRQPEIYGNETLDDTVARVRHEFPEVCITAEQSNCEGRIVDLIQQYGYDPACIGIVLNPGAYAHYSIAIADAIEAIPVPTVEVHISNIHAREEFRHKSVTARAARAIIAGAGREGYALAVRLLLSLSPNNYR